MEENNIINKRVELSVIEELATYLKNRTKLWNQRQVECENENVGKDYKDKYYRYKINHAYVKYDIKYSQIYLAILYIVM